MMESSLSASCGPARKRNDGKGGKDILKIQSEFLKQFAGLALPYWKSEDKWKGGALLAIIVVMNLGMVYVSVLVNNGSEVSITTCNR